MPAPSAHGSLASTRPPTISACIIARNECAQLAGCLDSLRTWVQEMIVVDTGSTDGTPQVAADRGARVVQATWENDFSKARNRSIDEAKGDWIFVLDADERVLPRDRDAILELVRTQASADRPASAYRLLQRSAVGPGSGSFLVALIRLFPNRPEIRYEWPIHEQVATALGRAGIPVVETAVEIQHLGYVDPVVNREKQRRNLAILENQAAAAGPIPRMNAFFLGGAYLDLGRYEPALAAYRKCQDQGDPADAIVRGARVRIVTCLLKLGRPADAVAEMPRSFDATWHPELILHRGEAEQALGHAADARRWFERVLACREGAFIPPCDIAALKRTALIALATHWKDAGKLPLGLALLTAAKRHHERGLDFGPDTLAAIYRDSDVAHA